MQHLSAFLVRTGFSLCLLFALSWHVAAQDKPEGSCTLTEACKCKFDNDFTIDLTPLASETGPRFPSLYNGDFYYDVNLCSDFTLSGCYDAAVCQYSGSLGYSCGSLSEAYFSSETNGDLTYNLIGGSDGRTSKIVLQCDEGDDDTMTAYGDYADLIYDFTLISKYACPLPPGDDPFDPPGSSISLTVGSILLIVFFAGLIAYFIVGVLVMKFGKNAEGKEVIPQSAFWTSLPGLIKEGWLFIWHKTCGGDSVGGGGGGGNYEKL